ncbi:hypothetical protein [Rhodopila sp.]|uniref:hypothetical protein n=1 Tax=Rhodopila sp. TaxID=2480087 RepID=UPI003D1366EF
MKKIDDLPDERKQNEDESDSDYSDRMHDKDDDQGDDADDKGDDTDAKKAKRARADDDMDDDEEGDDGSDGAEMKKKSARSARLRERARCAAIFADASAGKNPALAATVAFTTDLPRSQALAVLRAGGLAVAPAAPRKPTLDERMAAVRSPIAGAGDVANPTGVQGLAAQIIAAGTRRRAGG